MAEYTILDFTTVVTFSGSPLHKENRGNGSKNVVSENAGSLEILPKHSKTFMLKL